MTTKAREAALTWIWRLVAVAIWIWIIPRVVTVGASLRVVHRVPAHLFLLGVLGALMVYVALKPKRSEGCLALLWFPFYVLLLPITIPLVIADRIWSTTHHTLKRSQDVVFSAIPYVISAVTIAVTAQEADAYRGWIALSLIAIDLYLVILSLVAWIFQPLKWGLSALGWYLNFQTRRVRKAPAPASDELLIDLVGTRKRLRAAIVAYREAQSGLTKFPAIDEKYLDGILILGFARKFFVSLLHLAFLFGLAHYALNVTLPSTTARYAGLPRASLTPSLFDYFYFGVMTIITGETGAQPLVTSSKLLTLVNALTGIALLALLVTSFSMITRERTRARTKETLDEVERSLAGVESGVVDVAMSASAAGALGEEEVAELRKIAPFRHGRRDRYEALLGILMVQDTVDLLRIRRRFEDAGKLQARASLMRETDFAALYELRSTSDGVLDADQVTSTVDLLLTSEAQRAETSEPRVSEPRGGAP